MGTQAIDFSQYEEQPVSAEEQERRKQSTHQQIDFGKYTADTAFAAAHTAPGTGTAEGARMRQIAPPGALVSGREIFNSLARPPAISMALPGGPPASSMSRDYYQENKDEANRRFASGRVKGLPGMATDAADFASSFTTPVNIGLMAAGPATKILPAVKPLMALPGAYFAGSGAKDIAEAATDTEGEPAERLQKGLFGAAAVAGGAAGIGEASPRGAFNKGMDIAAPNEPFTPRELVTEARSHGVNLDLADATGAGLPVLAKRHLSRSIGGSGTFDRAQQGNVAALDQWGSEYLDNLSPYSGENAGARIKDALKRDYETRKGSASQEFQDLDKRVGPNTIDGTQTVEKQARSVVDSMTPYYEAHPDLVPRQAWKIMENLAERPTVDVNGKQVPAPAHNFSWSELHQLRSDLMDIYRNSPEIIKNKSDAWLQQMVKVIDDTMTGAASQLSPADKWQFRQANETWEGLKNTYDNPQHPLYHAVRAQQPSQVTGMLLNMKAPEFARQMKSVLGPEYGDLQRAVAERILGQDRTGAGFDFKTMPGRLSKYPQPYINDLLGPQAARDLRLMSRTGMTVFSTENPSGTAKASYPLGEGTGILGATIAGHPEALLVPPAEFGTARAMTSPRVVDFLTDQRRSRAMPRGAAIAGAANAMNPDEEDLARRLLRRPAEIAGPR